MSHFRCFIGIAFYDITPRHTQWVLVLSENVDFIGHCWCSTTADTVDRHVIISSALLTSSPASFKIRETNGLFLGVIRIGYVPISIDDLMVLISNSHQPSERDRTYITGTDDIPWGCDKYVILALLRLYGDRRIGLKLPMLKRDSLLRFIEGRVYQLRQRRASTPGSTVFPVVSLNSGNLSFGHAGLRHTLHPWS